MFRPPPHHPVQLRLRIDSLRCNQGGFDVAAVFSRIQRGECARPLPVQARIVRRKADGFFIMTAPGPHACTHDRRTRKTAPADHLDMPDRQEAVRVVVFRVVLKHLFGQ